jgi:hypothetical protein
MPVPLREQRVWNALARKYANSGVVLVLGAGLSMASRLPSWKTLICRLAERAAGPQGPALVTEMADLGYSSAAIAGVVKSLLGPGNEFLEGVRHELYRDFPFFRREDIPAEELVEFVRSSNPTLRAVGAFCARRQDINNFEPNPKVHAVVNFNLDAVLRSYTAYRYRTRILRTIERASAKASSSKINAYHVHGFLHFAAAKIGDPELETDSIVLAEDEYYEFFSKPLGMFSYTMLHLLREHTWLFLGLSMTDENLRRLLHYSYAERVTSYMAEGIPPHQAQLKCRRHFAILRHNEYPGLDTALEQSLANLGVKVAWVNHFDEVPNHLGQIYGGSAASWQDVY